MNSVTFCKIRPASAKLSFAYPAQIHLSRLEVLVPEKYFGDDLQRDAVPACVSGRMTSQVVGPYFPFIFSPSLFIKDRAVE
jgi:hypothetical protein